MSTTTIEYPQAGTKAQRVLQFIRDNPKTSRNAIISQLDLNPSVVRKAVSALIDHGVIVDEPTEAGHHQYSAK
jgi:DNA-binding IclR family transcriptional regulator